MKVVHRRMLEVAEKLPGISTYQLGIWFGLSSTEINRVLKEHGVQPPKGKQLLEDRPRLSEQHSRIGNALAAHIYMDRQIDHEQFAVELGWGVGKIRGLLAGVGPIELRDIQLLAEHFQVSQSDILNGKLNNEPISTEDPDGRSGSS